MRNLACTYGSLCSGCEWLLHPYQQQSQDKQRLLRTTLAAHGFAADEIPPIRFREIAAGGLRERVELVFTSNGGRRKLGLYDRSRREIVDLQGCPQMSPTLEAFFREVRKIDFAISKGSLRLRVSAGGDLRGAWLDFANVDIKNLLDEEATLRRLQKIAIVEIGQKRKRLIEIDGKLKLGDPTLAPWFETTLASGKAAALYSTIGTFTQPGGVANRALIEEVMSLIKEIRPERVAEFGAGIGNFTLPFASHGAHVTVFENDLLALSGLKLALDVQGLSSQVTIHAGDATRGASLEGGGPLSVKSFDLIFVDPPRSGLKDFIHGLSEMPTKPKWFIYLSCFTESFAQDVNKLKQFGYRLRDLVIVDQFPQTSHLEILARLEVQSR